MNSCWCTVAMSELCVGIRGVDSLKHELDRTRENLRDTDATIEKLTGRPAFANRPFARRGAPPRPVAGEPVGRGRGVSGSLFSLAGYDDAGPPSAKRVAGAFGRLGLPLASQRPLGGRRGRDEDEEDELPHKPSLQSSVIATPKDTKSRQDAIAEQQSGAGGAAGTARNRRMFGLLLGTLVRFKEDERTKEQQAEKRKAVELKLEEKQREERDRLKRERFQLFSDRRRHQAKLRALEQKMELVEIHSAWESETHSLENFIRTTAKPHVFFLPKSHIPQSQSKLDESKRVLSELITERRKQLEEELEEIMKEDKDDGNELEEYGHSGSENENEADNSEMADTDANEHKRNKSQKKTAHEESDLDESDMVGVDDEQPFAPETAHDMSAASESMQADVSEEIEQQTVEKAVTDKDTDERTDLQSQKASHLDDSKKDSSDVREGTSDVQRNNDKRRRKEHRDVERGREKRRRDSSRTRRHSEKRGSRERRRDREQRHSRSEQRRDRDDGSERRREHRRQAKDSHKRKERKKRREGSDSDNESGDKTKHSADGDQKNP